MYVIKYGGSRVRPTENSYDEQFIDSLISLTKKYSQEQFLIIIGGGALARKLQQEGEKQLTQLYRSDPDLIAQGKDLLGIRATRENARYVLERFQKAGVKKVCPKILTNPTKKVEDEARIYLAGGWKPGNSTDYVTLLFADTYQAKNVFKVSDFDYVKNISPLLLHNKNPEEKKVLLKKAPDLPSMKWREIVHLVGKEWLPGLNTPLDPPAALYGFNHPYLTLYIGKESELEKLLSGRENEFRGTKISGEKSQRKLNI